MHQGVSALSNVAKENVVLVAEDDPYMRNLVKLALGDVTVIEAENGDRALELYEKHKPNVVMLDIHMPGKNGKDVLKEILEIDANAYVVMMSADSVADNVLSTHHAGAKGFVRKPFKKEVILRYLQLCPTLKFNPDDKVASV
jgi:two-component system chemotaxis response regulator CheY